jgi:hypothetical protein
MPQTTQWAEPRLAEDGSNDREPDTEMLLAELGAFYPMFSYPTEEEPAEEALDRSIFAALIAP